MALEEAKLRQDSDLEEADAVSAEEPRSRRDAFIDALYELVGDNPATQVPIEARQRPAAP